MALLGPVLPVPPVTPAFALLKFCAFVRVIEFSTFIEYSISDKSVPFATPLWSPMVTPLSVPVVSNV